MMDVLSPDQIKNLCITYGFKPSKSYGQNYLISFWPIEDMIDAAELTSTDRIIEVGPGFGILTMALADRVQKVFGYEIEKKLQPYWEEKIKKYKNIEIIWGDVLKQFPVLSPYKLLANLPYQITSAVLRFFLEAEQRPERIVVMVQKEVAERICAKPPDMSLLSVSVQYFGTPRIVSVVSRENFWPVPDVDSAIVAIDVHQPTNTSIHQHFFPIVRAAFAHKRKQAWKNIASTFHLDGNTVKAILKDIAGNEKVRAEELEVDQWIKIVKEIEK